MAGSGDSVGVAVGNISLRFINTINATKVKMTLKKMDKFSEEY